MTYVVWKLFNPLNGIPHNSTNQVLSQVHLMQLIKGFISCTRCAWARTHEKPELARDLLSATFDCMGEIWQKKSKEWSKKVREEIITFLKQGTGHKKKALKVPRDTIGSIVCKFKHKGIVDTLLNRGKKKKGSYQWLLPDFWENRFRKTLKWLQKTCSKNWWKQALRFQFAQ